MPALASASSIGRTLLRSRPSAGSCVVSTHPRVPLDLPRRRRGRETRYQEPRETARVARGRELGWQRVENGELPRLPEEHVGALQVLVREAPHHERAGDLRHQLEQPRRVAQPAWLPRPERQPGEVRHQPKDRRDSPWTGEHAEVDGPAEVRHSERGEERRVLEQPLDLPASIDPPKRSSTSGRKTFTTTVPPLEAAPVARKEGAIADAPSSSRMKRPPGSPVRTSRAAAGRCGPRAGGRAWLT